jgi:DNA-binding transcriptional LysR family regulator
MELRQIRYFVAVANEGNFGRAAERLRMAQSGLSQQIMALERSLGVRLFDRSVRPIELTAEGTVFLEESRKLLELADSAVERVHSVSDERSTVLQIGGSAFGHTPRADELLRRAQTDLPGIDVRIHLDIAPNNIALLNRRDLDAVVSYTPFVSEETPNYLCLGSVEIVLAVPANHELATLRRIPRRALAHEPFLVGPREVNRPVAEGVYRSLFGQFDPPHPVHLSDYESRYRLAAEGAGIAPVMVPTEILVPLPGLVYRRLEDPQPTFEYGLLWFDDRLSPALTALLDLARELAAHGQDTPTDELLEELEAV